MKKQLILLALVCLSILKMNAQDMEHRSVVSGTVGLNAITLAANLFNNIDDNLGNNNFNYTSTPSFQLSYDYSLNKVISIGASGSFSTLNSKSDSFNWFVTDTLTSTTNSYSGSYNYKSTRLTAAARILFHYGGNNEKLDLYSGLRVGAKIWKKSITTTGSLTGILTEDDVWPTLSGLNAQIIGFGFRYYVTNNLGLGGELTFGAPYYAAFQANYRF